MTSLQVGSAALSPVIGIAAWWVARQQVRINRNKLKLDRFDRRFAIYEAAMTFVAQITTEDVVRDDRVREFLLQTRGARFMVSQDMGDYLNELRRKAMELQLVKQQLQGPPIPSDEQRARLADKWGEIQQWFQNQLDVLPEKFTPYSYCVRKVLQQSNTWYY